MKTTFAAATAIVALCATAPLSAQETGNVIFFHPDGTGVNHWLAARMHTVGPDGELNWDRLPAIGVYTGHMADRVTRARAMAARPSTPTGSRWLPTAMASTGPSR